jgi:hypothetical protein
VKGIRVAKTTSTIPTTGSTGAILELLPPDPPTYPNLFPHLYAEEADSARTSAVGGVACPSEGFDSLVAKGERLVFVITQGWQVIVAPQVTRGFEIRHPVLASGEDVLAAGEIELVYWGREKHVLEINNRSGHYEPNEGCLDVAVQVLRELGYTVDPAAVVRYP